jgi:RNA-directed DNA polymerase
MKGLEKQCQLEGESLACLWLTGELGRRTISQSPKALRDSKQFVRPCVAGVCSDNALDDLARMFNPYIRGWINYYGHFYQSALYPTLRRIDEALINWARRKFKRLRQKPKARGNVSRKWFTPLLDFTHWSLLYGRGLTLGAV